MSPPLRILQYSDLEGAYDEPDRLARGAGLLAARRDDRTLVVGTGDNTGPGALPLVEGGRQSIPFFERIRPDAETFGNHDFDYGLAAARDIAADSPQPWVCANARVGSEREPFGRAAGVVPSTVLEASGARVGVVGVAAPATPEMSTAAADLRIEDPVEAVGREIGRLRERGVDYLVVLSHLGASDDELARTFDLDAVLGGHVHAPRAEVVAGTPCTRPGANGHRVAAVDLEAGTARLLDVDGAPVDEGVRERFAAMREATGLGETVARAADPVERRRDLRTSGECRIGNFVADAYRWAADADLAVHNSGGIRDGPALSGAVTVADLVGVVPFDEPVAVAEVTGGELQSLFGEAYRAPHGEARWEAHVSGAEVVYDTDAREVRELRVDGAPVADDRTYALATNDYLLTTSREFPTLTERHRRETLDVQYEVLAAYARSEGIGPSREGRIEFHGKVELPPGETGER
ncbi:bifunctional metallophosphatase/5'-nucleotidase [Halobacteriales archaeon QS_5_70_17]|nr:MAG: bifunctional metallophosphatase/5'-nucleotidase [Halobacteriales archaeon QS_5_70_17]